MTAKTFDGKVIFKDSRIYMPQATTYRDEKMVFGAHNKAGYIRDTSLQPFTPRMETFQFRVPRGVRTLDLVVNLSYHLVPGNTFPIHKVTRRVVMYR